MRKLVSALCALTLFACGDDGSNAGPDAPPDNPDPGDGCETLDLGPAEFQFNVFRELTGLRYRILSGPLQNAQLTIEMYHDDGLGQLPALVPGTFDLTTAPNDNLATCQHCVFVAWQREDKTLELQYFQAEGEMQLTKITDPLDIVFAGKVNAKLRAATADENGRSTFAPKGACISIENLEFDTTPRDAPCEIVEECPNELLQVCDPRTQRCVEPQCIDYDGCADGQTCLVQMEGEWFGACYDLCDPADPDSCGPGFTCWQSTPRVEEGYCVIEGTGTLGQACRPGDSTSACVGDLMCSRESYTCVAKCQLFEDEPGCSPSTRCSIFGLCEPPSIADPATFGETCGPNAYLGAPCAMDAVGFQGYCFGYFDGEPLECIEACLNDGDCAEEQYCSKRFDTGLGQCVPDPVCGDGQVGEVDEACDDGNTEDGDACSADCRTVNYGPACLMARPVESGMTYAGDTRTGLDGFWSSCQWGRARTELYVFDPGVPGRLLVTVDSERTTAVSVLETCGAAPVENACRELIPGLWNTVDTQLLTGDPVTIAVAANTFVDEGEHTLRIDFTPENCGDGVIAGNEVCDDGNTDSNDGCSADCRTLEYAAACERATPLVLGEPMTGTTVGGQYYFEHTCGTEVSGPDRLYTFTAPAAGTLTLLLDQGEKDLVLSVFKGCGEPAEMEELACSAVWGEEQATVPLAAGETVTIVVDGFDRLEVGPYTLTGTFQ